MFKNLTLAAILKSFTLLQTQLGEFIKGQEEKLKVNADKRASLAEEAEFITSDMIRASNVLKKVTDLVS